MVPMKDGLAFSDNRITSRIMCELGDPHLLVDFARRLQIESPMDAVPSLCLGTCDVSLTEMVGAYSCFANLGTYSKPHFIQRIEDKNGNVLAQFTETHKEAIPEKTAYVLTQMLKGVIDKGTAARLRPKYGLDMPLAGKTGTTQANADAWFMCYSPDLVVGAWVGFEQPSVHFISNSSGAGATAALPIVGEFLKRAYADRTEKLSREDFALPSDSTFNINFDCSALPVPVDTVKKTNVVSQWFADIKAKHQENAARKDSIAKVAGKKEKHPLLKKLKRKANADGAQ
jgi:penicillin-binding protein 1A